MNVNERRKHPFKKEERERKKEASHQPHPPSPVCTVVQKIYKYKKKKSLVSQTALEGSHCDCENDWDLINSPQRLM